MLESSKSIGNTTDMMRIKPTTLTKNSRIPIKQTKTLTVKPDLPTTTYHQK
jgi:hypothetical protein